MTESPILPARDCPPEMLPKQLTAAVTAAEATGWRWVAKIAIGPLPDGKRSVSLLAGRGPVRVNIVVEGDTAGAKMSFASASISPGVFGIPDRVGYREAIAFLKTVPEDQLIAPGMTLADVK